MSLGVIQWGQISGGFGPCSLIAGLGELKTGLGWDCLLSFSQHYSWVLRGRVLRPSIPRKPGKSSVVFLAQRHKFHIVISAILYLQSSHKDLRTLGEEEDMEPTSMGDGSKNLQP